MAHENEGWSGVELDADTEFWEVDVPGIEGTHRVTPQTMAEIQGLSAGARCREWHTFTDLYGAQFVVRPADVRVFSQTTAETRTRAAKHQAALNQADELNGLGGE